jgi:uncharacterized membrane protein/protein-disulfide isomerase
VHYHLLYDPRYASFCDVNATFNCTQVYQSRFSTVRGIPVALFGATWFGVAGLLAIAGLTAKPAVRESVPGYLFIGSTLALATILYFAYLSFFVIKAVCILCLLTYAAVIGLFAVSIAAMSVPMSTLPRRALHDLRIFVGSPLAITMAVITFAAAGSALAFFPREAIAAPGEPAVVPAITQDQRSEFERWYAAQPRIPLMVPAEGAKVLVVKFNDFQCPACGQSYLQYKPIFAKYEADHPGAVRLVLKDFPLNSECNSNIGRTLHPAACDAAVAVRLARAHNRSAELEDWLYTHQQTMTGPAVREAARDVGQVTDFEAKYASTLVLVKGDVTLGTQLRVQSTPTFFINGVRVEGSLPPQYFEQAISIELQRAQ